MNSLPQNGITEFKTDISTHITFSVAARITTVPAHILLFHFIHAFCDWGWVRYFVRASAFDLTTWNITHVVSSLKIKGSNKNWIISIVESHFVGSISIPRIPPPPCLFLSLSLCRQSIITWMRAVFQCWAGLLSMIRFDEGLQEHIVFFLSFQSCTLLFANNYCVDVGIGKFECSFFLLYQNIWSVKRN